jgi:alpha-tubulin suppressor-like RCC1 family protein
MVVRLLSPAYLSKVAPIILALVATACLPTEKVEDVMSASQKTSSYSSSSGKSKKEYNALTVANNEAPSPEVGVSKIAVGKQHVCALKNGYLFCWGLNSRGQIGSGKSKSGSLPGDSKKYYTQNAPHLVFNEPNVTDVAVGLEHTCALRAGKLFCWGSNEFGQVGKGNSHSFFPVPEALVPNETFVQIASRGLFSCAVSVGGKLFCWGARPVHKGAKLEPKVIATTPLALNTGGASIQRISMSEYHSCFLTTHGSLSCWGLNGSGEIGNGDKRGLDVNEPYEVFAQKATQVALSEGRTCALVDSEMKCWGYSLGDRKQDAVRGTDGWNVREPRPYDSVFFAKVSPYRKMSSRGAILSEDQKLYYGSYLHFEGTPKVIAEGVIDFDYSEAEIVGCVMFKNRKVKCWGSNLFGQFGNGKAVSSDANLNWYQATDSDL